MLHVFSLCYNNIFLNDFVERGIDDRGGKGAKNPWRSKGIESSSANSRSRVPNRLSVLGSYASSIYELNFV